MVEEQPSSIKVLSFEGGLEMNGLGERYSCLQNCRE